MPVLKMLISKLLFPVPLSLSVALTGLGLLWFTERQKAGKVVVSVGIGLFLMFSNELFSDMLLGMLERHEPPLQVQFGSERLTSKEEHAIKYVVVLGGGHDFDPTIPVTGQLNEVTLVRMVEGIRLYRKYPGSKLILSGGKAAKDRWSEAELMAQLAQELGISEDDLLLESASKDTKDEALLLQPWLGNAPFLLVTSASHLPRARLIFEKQGMHPLPAPTEYRVKNGQHKLYRVFSVSASGLYKTERVWYEYLAIMLAKFRNVL